jgi:hypothetical protein
MFHNAQAQRVREETMMLCQHWDSDPNFRKRLQDNDPELAKALTNRQGDTAAVEKIISERLKEVMAKKRAEQERLMKLRNADPNDVEAQKLIEEEIRKSMIEQNYMKAMD